MNPSGEPLQYLYSIPYNVEWVMHEALWKDRARGEWFITPADRIVERLKQYHRLIENSDDIQKMIERLHHSSIVRYRCRAPIEWLIIRRDGDYMRTVYECGTRLCSRGNNYFRVEPDYDLIKEIWYELIGDTNFRRRVLDPDQRDSEFYSEYEKLYHERFNEQYSDATQNSENNTTWTFAVQNSEGKVCVASTSRTIESKLRMMEQDRYINHERKPLKLIASISYDVAKIAHEDFLEIHNQEKYQCHRSLTIKDDNKSWFYSREFETYTRHNWQIWYDITSDEVIKKFNEYKQFIECSNHIADRGFLAKVRTVVEGIPFFGNLFLGKTEILDEKEFRRRKLWDEAHFQQTCRDASDRVKHEFVDNYKKTDPHSEKIGLQDRVNQHFTGSVSDYQLIDSIVNEKYRPKRMQKLLHEAVSSISKWKGPSARIKKEYVRRMRQNTKH